MFSVKPGEHPRHPRDERARRVGGDGALSLWILGEVISFRARVESHTLLEVATLPGGGLPPHVHHAQDEVIYILEGEYTLVIGDEEKRLVPGSFASVPRGTVHVLKVSGGEPGRTLTVLAPPGPLESFFEEVGVPVADAFAPTGDAPEVDEVAASARRHGTDLLTKPV